MAVFMSVTEDNNFHFDFITFLLSYILIADIYSYFIWSKELVGEH